ncbi:unnamed protein product [Arctia plantaginis]|uniref:Uncharacterized protein n=1 Tax=Arctia plantaginis TaxID=874455 RepID=A0A8S0ZYQ8_ARCPL|nr:unnamed protein product [Arctia plantaginis]
MQLRLKLSQQTKSKTADFKAQTSSVSIPSSQSKDGHCWTQASPTVHYNNRWCAARIQRKDTFEDGAKKFSSGDRVPKDGAGSYVNHVLGYQYSPNPDHREFV